MIFVNDGSTDRSWQVIEQLAEKSDKVKGIKFRRNYGKSPALYCGFKAAKGDVVITMDADLQDSPDEIPGLYHMIVDEGYDLVSGYKQNRKQGDPLSKTIPTKLFNATARKVSGIPQPARLQLRTEGLPQGRGEEHRGVRRDAPIHSVLSQRTPASTRLARSPFIIRLASSASRSLWDGTALSTAIWTLSRCGS